VMQEVLQQQAQNSYSEEAPSAQSSPRGRSEVVQRLREWATDLRSQQHQGAHGDSGEGDVKRTVNALNCQATFFREVVREVVADAPEIGSLLLEAWNMNMTLLVSCYERRLSAAASQGAMRDSELHELENQLEFIQTQVSERVLDYHSRSQQAQLHELKMACRAKEVELAEQQAHHTHEMECVDGQLLAAVARAQDMEAMHNQLVSETQEAKKLQQEQKDSESQELYVET